MFMEGWLNLRDKLALHEVQFVEAREVENGSALDPDFCSVECGLDESKSRLRVMFNRVLMIFLEEISVNKCIRPLPVLCPDGLPVDLFKLFWVVKRVGGYDLVSRRNLWGFVAEECGLRFGEIAYLKLIYIKYLHELDHWLKKAFRESSLADGGSRVVKKLELLLRNLKEEDRGLFLKGKKGEKKEVMFDKTRNEIGSCHTSRLSVCSSSRDSNDMHDHAERKVNDDEKLYLENSSYLSRLANLIIQKMFNEDEFSKRKFSSDEKYSCSEGENGVAVSTEKVIEKFISRVHDSTGSTQNSSGEGIYADTTDHSMSSAKNLVATVPESRKRKRESLLLSGMLNWLLHVAKHPDDPAVGSMPESSKWKDEGDEEFWYQVLLVREALLTKRRVNSNASSQQKKFRMHPSMYEDALNHQSVDKSRCSQRQPVIKSPTCSCCNSVQTKVASPQKVGAGNCPKELLLGNVELSAGNKTDSSMEEPCEKQVSVGPLFQAEVPEWTGDVFDSDSKWLGEQMWSPEDAGDAMVIDLDPIGKGRPYECDCLFPNTTECIRFHIAEKRLKLKRELGSLFYKWRFHHMGEEVSLSWTKEEENKFKDMLILHSASTNKFWNNASKLFPSKTREVLVSYYFNVFLIQRRNYQNRVTPKDIDSDDDEKEFGLVGDRFGYKAIYVPKSRLPICLENKQCADWE